MAFVSNSDDLFDSIIMADDRFHDEGYQEGFEEGTRQGTFEGRNHGLLHGAKLGAEVSFYYGFALAWKCLLQNNSDVKARKRLKAMESLIGVIQNFPYEDPQYEKLQEDMERVRAKFRQVCSLLNVATDFKEYVSGSTGMSF
ncbi:protein LTO1 homolog [Carassius carassius]|uniref:protein LTO1 homolog n=1 Tax=Carassius carassius TaxID=217509 RepID=UPI002868621D|nr:protein LTO1 homolog [Carassius carassius]